MYKHTDIETEYAREKSRRKAEKAYRRELRQIHGASSLPHLEDSLVDPNALEGFKAQYQPVVNKGMVMYAPGNSIVFKK